MCANKFAVPDWYRVQDAISVERWLFGLGPELVAKDFRDLRLVADVFYILHRIHEKGKQERPRLNLSIARRSKRFRRNEGRFRAAVRTLKDIGIVRDVPMSCKGQQRVFEVLDPLVFSQFELDPGAIHLQIIDSLTRFRAVPAGAGLLIALESDIGRLTPEALVEAASHSEHALHSRFSWDDEEMAYKKRLEAARAIIRDAQLKVEMDGRNLEVPYFVRDPSALPNEQGYRRIDSLADLSLAKEATVKELEMAGAYIRRARDIAFFLGYPELFDELVTSLRRAIDGVGLILPKGGVSAKN